MGWLTMDDKFLAWPPILLVNDSAASTMPSPATLTLQACQDTNFGWGASF